MPWAVADVDSHKAGLSEKQKRQWVHIANECLAGGKEEGACIRMANSATNGTKEFLDAVESAKDYQYVDSWEYSEHLVSQSAAGYNPLGATDTQGCANCQFFIAPGRCAVVAGTISPTGLSSLWRAVEAYVAEPIPVTIVGGSVKSADSDLADERGTGLLAGLRELITRFGQRSATSLVHREPSIQLFRQKDGRTRFYTAWSNNFIDREGEIFTGAAHKEFVKWADDHKEYPELWVWHTLGSRFGQVDWLDYTDDGFVHASGLVDAGKEAFAETLAQEDNGVSHGFFGLQQANLIHWYRSYEISVLPRQNAAVPTTSFNILNSGAKEMAFNQKKRDFFTGLGIGEEQIKQWETQTEGLAKALTDAGLQSKAADLGLEAAPVVETKASEPATPAAPAAPTVDPFQLEILKSLNAQQELLGVLAGQIKSIDERTKDLKSSDQVVAAAMAPPVTASVIQASKSDGNVVSEAAPAATGAKEFFDNTVLNGLVGTKAQ